MNGYFKYLTLGILLPMLACCSIFEYENVPEKMDAAKVSFTLNIASQSMTKGDTGVENNIDLSSLHVMAYDTEGNYVADLPILKSGVSATGVYSFLCGLEGGLYEANKAYKFVLLVNCTNNNSGIIYNADGPNLESLEYSFPIGESIPMWGVTTFTLPASVPESKEFNMGEISVLRAASKIRVNLSDAVIAEGYKLEELSINYISSDGYSVPANWNSVASTSDMGLTQGFRPTDNLASNVITFSQGETSRYIYVPETTNDTDELAISVKVSNEGEIFEFPYEIGIKFRNYTDGLPEGEKFNIDRNHFYDYTITEINVGLELNLTVSDWFEGPTWDLDQYESPQNTNILPAPFENATAPTAVPVVRYTNGTEEGACTVFFKMSGPMGISSWKPTLLNASARDYAVRVYEVEINGTDYVVKNEEITGDIPANNTKFYAIKVVAINQAVLTRTEPINLAIGYNAQWNPGNISLLVVNSNGYWPVPTGYNSDQLYVQIKQQQ